AARLARRDRAQAVGYGRRNRGVRERVRDGLPALTQRLLAGSELLEQRMRRRDADDACEALVGNRDARELLGAGDAAVDLPLDEVRVGNEVREVAEAGDDRGRAEVGGLVLEE